jgi:hypothetical protein
VPINIRKHGQTCALVVRARVGARLRLQLCARVHVCACDGESVSLCACVLAWASGRLGGR